MESHKYTNELIHETSPYLLQHAHNPVNWKAWNPKTLEEAQKANKLMVISVGYAACHWCHVMEHESFEDSTVAAVMNAHYIAIKVDREERPDVDQTYINAVQLMTGNAGWPLNVITLPNGKPIFGGTYFKKEAWIQALEQVQELYETEPQKLMDYAARLEEGIKSVDLVTFNNEETDWSNYQPESLIAQWSTRFDTIDGGTRGAPKFMMPNQLAYLLQLGTATQDNNLIAFTNLTLKKMAYGGVYDQVDGGFARYSTDDRWHVPHFEKMLYDNAQLVSLYSQAYAYEPNPLYKKVVEETLSFITKEMTSPEGVFYSSLDADSPNENGTLEEGAFYTFTKEELQKLIENDWPLFEAYYNINDFGLWKEENKYVLIRKQTDSEIAQAFSISLEQLQEHVANWKSTLSNYRQNRKRPRLDDKTLTSWNALMLKGYVDAYKAFGTPIYLETAKKNARFLLAHQLLQDGVLLHTYKDGKSSMNGYLEDYALLADAYIGLYEVTLDLLWIETAKKLTDRAYEKFFDDETHMFYFTSKDDPEIITRNYEFRDNVIPASNSVMAKNLMVLSHHYDLERYRNTALQMLQNVQPEMEKYPSNFPNWLSLLENFRNPYYEIVVMGTEAQAFAAEINRKYLPNKLVAGSVQPEKLPLMENRFVEGKTLVYVCVNNTCKLPVTSASKAVDLMDFH